MSGTNNKPTTNKIPIIVKIIFFTLIFFTKGLPKPGIPPNTKPANKQLVGIAAYSKQILITLLPPKKPIKAPIINTIKNFNATLVSLNK